MLNNPRVGLKINLPTEISAEFLQISVESGVQPEELASSVLTEYISSVGVFPPPAEVIVDQLQQIQHEFEQENVLHLSLYGSVARNEAKRGSDIDLLAEFECRVGLKKWTRTIEIAERKLGSKAKIDLLPKSYLRESALKSAKKDAIKIF